MFYLFGNNDGKCTKRNIFFYFREYELFWPWLQCRHGIQWQIRGTPRERHKHSHSCESSKLQQ